jgi:hypothetical protein
VRESVRPYALELVSPGVAAAGRQLDTSRRELRLALGQIADLRVVITVTRGQFRRSEGISQRYNSAFVSARGICLESLILFRVRRADKMLENAPEGPSAWATLTTIALSRAISDSGIDLADVEKISPTRSPRRQHHKIQFP